MVKTVIADTDSDNLRNFKTFIRTQRPEYTVTKTLSDVDELFAVLAGAIIQLLIADIRFFGVNGYQVIRRINKSFPDLKIILYGTYDEAEYMERMLDFGVIGFMYKPVKPADLNRSLLRAVESIKRADIERERKNNLIKSYDDSKPVFEDRFLINLIHGNIEKEREAKDGISYFKFNIESPYRVFVLKINNYKQVSLVYNQQEKMLLIYTLLKLVQDKFDVIKNGKAFINHFNTVTGIIGSDYPFEKLIEMCEEIKGIILRDLKISVTIGLGRTVEEAIEIPTSYKQAKSALRYKYYMGEGVIIPIDFVEPENKITYNYPLKKEELLVYSAVVGDLEKALSCLDAIFNALRNVEKKSKLPERLLPKMMVEIALSIDRYETEQKADHANLFSKLFSVKDVMQNSRIEDFYEYFKTLLTNYCASINDIREKKAQTLIDRIKQQIDTKYFDNISLSKVALDSGCVPEYLNKLFKEKEGKSYYDYVVTKRIDAAKKMLQKPDVDEESIAISIGYEDVKYFRGIFQQHEGITPEEYRDMYGRGVLDR